MVRKRKVPLNGTTESAIAPAVETVDNAPEIENVVEKASTAKKTDSEDKNSWMKEFKFNFSQAATNSELSKRIDDLADQLCKTEYKRKYLKDKYKRIKKNLYAADDDDESVESPETVEDNALYDETLNAISDDVAKREVLYRNVDMRDAIDYSKFRFQ